MLNKFLLSSLLLLIPEITIAQVTITDLKDIDFKMQNGIETAFFKDGAPFAGAFIRPDEQGRNMTYFYREGRKNGVAVAYYENGKPELEITYAKGRKNGEEISFYINGNAQYKKMYKDDLLHGEEILFDENGKPQRLANYKNGKLNGEVIYFDADGNQAKIETFVDDVKNGAERIIENNILREENNYVDGKLDGLSKKFDTKYLTEEINYKDGKKNGLHTVYKEDGSKIETPYVNDVKSGNVVAYYPNGNIANKAVFFNNKKNGILEKFYQDGVVSSIENYIDDQKDGIGRYFNQKGNLQSVSYYEKGVELSKVGINSFSELNNVYDAYKKGQISNYALKKNYWYLLLWLGLNTEKDDIIQLLDKSMKMYAADIADEEVYQKAIPAKSKEYNEKLYFNLTPLGYAINIGAKPNILHLLSAQKNLKNAKGTTNLQEAVRIGNLDTVKYLLLHKTDINTDNSGNKDIVLYALKNGARNEIILELLKAGASPNITDDEGSSPMSLAVEKQNTELFDILAKHKADSHILAPKGQTILFYAYRRNTPIEVMEQFIKAGADINQKDSDGKLMVVEVLKSKNQELASMLLQNGADVTLQDMKGESALSYALENNIDTELEKLIFAQVTDPLQNVAKINKPLWKVLVEKKRLDLLKNLWDTNQVWVNQKDGDGDIPFYKSIQQTDYPELRQLALSYVEKADDDMVWTALKAEDIDLFKYMIEHQANVNARNDEGDTLLIYAIKHNMDMAFVEILETPELEINAFNRDNRDALEIAISRNNITIVKNLLEHGANANRKIDGKTYLMNLKNYQSEIAKALVEHNADINAIESGGRTVLINAVMNLNATLVELLLQNKVDSNVKDVNGEVALLYLYQAIKNHPKMSVNDLAASFRKIIKLLAEYGADINAQDPEGNTLLLKLAKQKEPVYSEVYHIMEEVGANLDMKDQYGKKATDYMPVK